MINLIYYASNICSEWTKTENSKKNQKLRQISNIRFHMQKHRTITISLRAPLRA